MNHNLKSIILVVILISLIAAIGFLAGNQGITAAVVGGGIACYDDQDCSDDIAATEDICRNPGTEYSLCINRITP